MTTCYSRWENGLICFREVLFLPSKRQCIVSILLGAPNIGPWIGKRTDRGFCVPSLPAVCLIFWVQGSRESHALAQGLPLPFSRKVEDESLCLIYVNMNPIISRIEAVRGQF